MSFFSRLRNRNLPRLRKHKLPRQANRLPSLARLRFEQLEDRCLLTAGFLDPTFGSGAPVGSLIYDSTESAVAGTEVVVYLADFESGDQGFSVDNTPPADYIPGLWHLSTGRGEEPGHSANTSFYYGQSEGPHGLGTYSQSTTIPSTGTITSPSIVLPTSGPLVLDFNYVLKTRVPTPPFASDEDIAALQINAGSGWTTLERYDAVAESSAWTTSSPLDLTAYAGTTIQLRWLFDTVRGPAGRRPEGWYVDDIQITTQVPDAPDTFTIAVDPGQTITVAVATDATLQASVTLLAGANGNIAVASGTASAPGQEVVLQTVATTGQIANNGSEASIYRVVVGGANGTIGKYSVRTILNAALENESHGGATNDTRDTAQNLEPSFISLLRAGNANNAGAQPARAAVLGTSDSASAAPPVNDMESNSTPDMAQNLDDETFTVAPDPNIEQSRSLPHLTILGSGDGTFDYYSFTVANAGDVGIFDIDVSFPNTGPVSPASLNSELFLYNSGGALLAQNDDRVGAEGSVDRRDSYIQFTFTAPGTYIIGVGEFDSFDSGGQIAGNAPDSGDIYTLQVSLAGKPFTPATPDLYSFNLDAGESATVAVTALSTGNVSVELQNSAGTTVATGSGPRINVDEVISNFVAPATGTYFAVVGSGGVDYSLLVTRNADFDTEDNNDLASAREVLSTPVAGRQWVLGSLGTGPSLTVDAGDSGWWDSTGSHDASNDNYIAGALGGTQYRDFFVFDLSAVSLPIIGAQLRLSEHNGYGSLDPTETYTVFDVTTPIPALQASGSGQTDIFADLGTGASFGATTVPKADNGDIDSVTLNAAALASLNASSGGLAAVGGALTTLDSSNANVEILFGGTGSFNVRQLVLTLLDPADFYQVTLTAGQALEVETSTPGGGAGAFENPLDPTIRVYDSGGNLVASDDNSAFDGRNARLTYPVPGGAGGTYYVAVAASSATTERTAGEYILSINVNEAPTDIALSPSSVAENEPAGTAVGAFSTTDPDTGDTHTYTLVSGTGDADNASFTIDAGGNLKTAASFDFEARSSYSILVLSSDAGGLSVERVFTINVTNVNEAPTIGVPVTQTAYEDVDQAISGLSVGDPEGDNLSVTLQVSHGSLSLGSTAGLSVSGIGSGSVTLAGSLADLNAALAGLVYRGGLNFSGCDTLAITASDGTLISSNSVAITVQSAALQAADLQAQVNALRDAGVMNQGQADSLNVKLDLKDNAGDIGKVQSFLNQVAAYLNARILTQAQADALTAAGKVLLVSVTHR